MECDAWTGTISDLAGDFDELMHLPGLGQIPTKPKALGFTIGTGKKMHWYIGVSRTGNTYSCYQTHGDGHAGNVRYVHPDQEITIHYLLP